MNTRQRQRPETDTDRQTVGIARGKHEGKVVNRMRKAVKCPGKPAAVCAVAINNVALGKPRAGTNTDPIGQRQTDQAGRTLCGRISVKEESNVTAIWPLPADRHQQPQQRRWWHHQKGRQSQACHHCASACNTKV